MNPKHRSAWKRLARTFVAVAEKMQEGGKPTGFSSESQAGGRRLRHTAIRPLVLEQRFMFDGAAVATAVDSHVADTALSDALAVAGAVAAQTEQGVFGHAQEDGAEHGPQVLREADPALNNGRTEVAFVDTGVVDWQRLVEGIRPGVEVVLLDAGESGLAQIAAWAQTHSGYDAIHLLSHGSDGVLYLGSTVLSSASLNDVSTREKLAAVGASLAADGDLMLYGCDLAASQAGQDFIATLSDITGADVAASDDSTGTTRLGGDWSLEKTTGTIDTASVMASGSQNTWDHELANTTADFTTSTVASDYSSVTTTVNGVTITITTTSSDGITAQDNDALMQSWGYTSFNQGVAVYKRNGMDTFTDPVGDSDPINVSFSSAVNLVSIDYLAFMTDTSVDRVNDIKITFTPTDGSANSAVILIFDAGDESTYFAPVTLGWTGVTSFSIVRTAYPTETRFNVGIDNFVFNTAPTGPTVTDGNISVTSTGSGSGGTYKMGDTVTARWNNGPGGDNQSGITGVSMDFSAFGGGSSVVATDDGSGNWIASYTITAGTIDATNLNVSVKVTDTNGATITADSTNLTVDNQAPTVTDARISIISTGSGIGGAYKTGDTVTVSWNNTGAGDNNGDISSVTADFSAFGGGSAVTATNNGSGSWSASYIITAGSIDASGRNVSITATDNAGNITTTADTTGLVVDNQAPTVTDANVSIAGATGSGGIYKVGDTVTATWDNTGAGDNNADTISGVTFDFTAFGGGAAVSATHNGSGTWTATYVITAGSISASNLNVSATATDNAGNATTRADSTNASVDNQAPVVTSVSVPSNGTYGNGQGLDFTVNFAENVTVDTTGGTPRIALTIGGATKYATYVSGSGTSALVFRYTVEAGLSDADGITVGALSANGGTLRDSTGNNATVTLSSVGATSAVLVDSAAPTLSSSTPADNANGVSSFADIVLNFNENITKGTGNIVIKRTSDDAVIETIAVGDAKVTVSGSQVTINPDTTLLDSTEYYVLIDSGVFTDGGGNAYAGISSSTALSFTTTDTTAPLLLSSTPMDNAISVAASADIVLSFNESVAKGTGNIVIKKTSDDSIIATIDVTSGQVTVSGSLVTINPASDLAFGTEYYVQIDAGAIKDTSNNNYAGISDTTSLSFTTGGPSVTGVTSIDGSYKAGETVDITVSFNGAVDVTGTPSLALANGATASYVSGSGTSALVFRYTVAAGNTSADLDYASTSALSLAGGSIIANGGSVAAVLALPTPGGAGSLGNNQDIVIDTAAPTVVSIDRQTPSSGTTNADTVTFRVTFGEAVANVDAADFTVTGTTGTVTNVVSAGGNAYDVTVSGGDLASLDGTVTLGFAGGQNIVDTAGNALSSTTPTGTNNASYTLDNTAPAVASIERQTPASGTTNADSVVYRVTFAEAVINVDAADFTVTGTTGTVTSVLSAGGNAYDVTVSGGDLSSLNGVVTLGFAGGQNVVDSAGNALTITIPTGTNDAVYTLDNIAPTVTAGQSFDLDENMAAGFVIGQIAASDANGVADYAITSGNADGFFAIDSNGVITLTAAGAADGAASRDYESGPNTFNLGVTATDGAGNVSVSQTVTINVLDVMENADTPVLSAPTLSLTDTAAADSFANQSGTLSATDTDGIAAYGITGGTTGGSTVIGGVTYDIAKVGIYGTLYLVGSGADMGKYVYVPDAGAINALSGDTSESFTVTATDANASPLTGSAVLTINLVAANDTPVVDAPVGAQSFSGAGNWSFTVPAGTFVDADGDALALSASLADGSPLPAWLSFDAATGSFSGNPPNGIGSLTLRVTASDGQGGTASDDFTLTLSQPNDLPAVDQLIGDKTHSGAGNWSFTVPAGTFVDADGDALALSASLADGSPLPAWLSFDAATGSFSGNPPNGIGSLTLRVTASDGQGGTASDDFTLTLSQPNDLPAVDQPIGDKTHSGAGNWSFTVPAGTFVDADGDALALSASLADGSPLPAWLSFDAATGSFSGNPPNGIGSLTLRVTASDGQGGTASDDFTLTLSQPNDEPTVSHALPAQFATEVQPFSFILPADTFADADGDVLVLSASLADSSPLPAWLSFDPATGHFSGTPDNADVGSLSIRVSANDGAGGSVAATFSLTVADVNQAPSGTLGVAGNPMAGDTLRAVNGIVDPDGMGSVSYQWEFADDQGNWVAIAGATGDTLVLDGGLIGKQVRVVASYVDAGGAGETMVSAATPSVAALPPPMVAETPVSSSESTGQPAIAVETPSSLPTPPALDFLPPTFILTAIPPGGSVPSVTSAGMDPGFASGREAQPSVGTLTVPVVPGGFQVVVLTGATAGSDALLVNRGMSDVSVASDSVIELSVPIDAFAHTNPQARVQLQMTLADGRPLPAWVEFDPRSGKLKGTPPPGFSGELAVKLVARDGQGHEAATVFRLVVGKEQQAPEGRSGLSEQLRLAARPLGVAERLTALSQSVDAARRLRA